MGYFSVKTYPILGNNDLIQNLFTLSNKKESRVKVNVRRLLVQNDPILALASVMPLVKTSRASNISMGVIVDKNDFDTTIISDAGVEVRMALYEGAPIIATAEHVLWEQFASRVHSAVEQVRSEDNNLLPFIVADTGKEFVLRPGESILVQVVSATILSNNMFANNWFVEAIWEEVALSEFNISGVVTLSGVPVVGAKIIIVESTDKSMSNAILREIKTTGAGGIWSSSIRTGWVGAAFVQYESGGTLYNAPGSPFLEA